MKINDSLLMSDQKAIINDIVQTIYPDYYKKATVTVKTLGRHGYSGAKLCLMKTSTHPMQRHVVKFASLLKVEAESSALRSVKKYFADASVAPNAKDYFKKNLWGAICYPHFSSHKHKFGKSTELEQFCYLTNAGRSDMKKLANAIGLPDIENADNCGLLLKGVFGLCKNAHEKATLKNSTWEKQYRRAFKHRDEIDFRLNHMLGFPEKKSTIQIFGVAIANPLLVLDDLLKQRSDFLLGPIHGDLHSTNVMYDHVGKPRLIDFEWAETRGVTFKDFTLMECSLRYMVFPSHRDPELHLLVDNACLEEDGLEELKGTRRYKGFPINYHRLVEMLIAIRSSAKAVSTKKYSTDWFSSYLRHLFVMHYRLHQYPGYDLLSTRALGLLGRKIS